MINNSSVWKRAATAAIVTAMMVMPVSLASAAKEKNKTVEKAASKAQPVAPAEPPVPSPEAITIFVRSALSALDQANMTNNYSVLYQMGSTKFRSTTSPEKLSQAFKWYRDNRAANGIDLAPVMVLPPQLSTEPTVKGGQLHLVGFFPSKPMQVNYDLNYEVENGSWRLSGLAVNLVQVPAGN